jgi:hypothetical protein
MKKASLYIYGNLIVDNKIPEKFYEDGTEIFASGDVLHYGDSEIISGNDVFIASSSLPERIKDIHAFHPEMPENNTNETIVWERA